MASSLQRARKTIGLSFSHSRKSVLTQGDLQAILKKNRDRWKLPPSLKFSMFLKFAVAELGLRIVKIEAEEKYPSIIRYLIGDASPFAIAQSLVPESYLTHSTAVFLHGLTDQIPKTIYVNQEQKEKPGGGTVTQQGIQSAFSRRQRVSTRIYVVNENRVVLLNGKQTGHLGVAKIKGPGGGTLDVTGLERTLIDIVVRPAYSGGVYQVLDAYRNAKGRVSVERLVRTLGRLGYLYPYQQAIGFLMEKTGYPEEDWRQLLDLGTPFDFYLVHGMRDPLLDSRWRLFYPQGL